MQLAVTFRRMDPSEALKQHVEDKLERIKKFFPDPIRAQIVMSTERHRHQIDVNITLANGITIKGKEIADDMYSAVDLVMDKVDRQIRRYKDKITTYRPQAGQEPPVLSPEAEADLEEQLAEEHQEEGTPGR